MGMPVKLWTASTSLVNGNTTVLETLAATTFQEDVNNTEVPNYPLIWLTQNSLTLSSLPQGSRWILWQNNNPSDQESMVINRDSPGIVLQTEQELQPQLQKPLQAF
jgi:hypothetical protein